VCGRESPRVTEVAAAIVVVKVNLELRNALTITASVTAQSVLSDESP
jgi:hypothetical protein